MRTLSQIAMEVEDSNEPLEISPLADQYLDQVSGSEWVPVGFREFYQNGGQPGGPATGGGAFWQQVVVYEWRKEVSAPE